MMAISTRHDPTRHSPAPLVFLLGHRLSRIVFPRGILAAFASAPGGAFGKVLVGSKEGIDVAVKVLIAHSTPRESFQAESEMLLHLRGKVDAVRELEARGVALTLADRGARHVAYVYGVGEEADLSAVDPGLPPPGIPPRR